MTADTYFSVVHFSVRSFAFAYFFIRVIRHIRGFSVLWVQPQAALGVS